MKSSGISTVSMVGVTSSRISSVSLVGDAEGHSHGC